MRVTLTLPPSPWFLWAVIAIVLPILKLSGVLTCSLFIAFLPLLLVGFIVLILVVWWFICMCLID